MRVYSLTRRQLLERLGLGVAVLAGGKALAGCGDDGAASPDTRDTGDASDVPDAAPDTTPDTTPETTDTPDTPDSDTVTSGILTFANWSFYIDQDEAHGGFFATSTLEDFESETGIALFYLEEIEDNESFVATLLPDLEAGEATGWDLVVLTDFMVARLMRRGFVERLDAARLTNVDNLRAAFKDPPFDPGRAYSIPWQAGLTGIAYDIDKTGRELTSVQDLFDPAFAGYVSVLHSMRDTVGLIMLGQGKDPSQAPLADAQAAVQALKDAIDAGQMKVSGHDYLERLVSGQLWVSVGWSGDILQLQRDRPNIRFLVPSEGAMLWSDNLIVLKGVNNKAAAETLIDFYLRPEIAAKLTSWVQYVSPVEGAQEALRQHAESLDNDELRALADNPLLFPDAATLARTFVFRALDEEEEQALNAAFVLAAGE